MRISGNTILITGGTSGIGRALAEAFHQRGNQVIIAGRRRALLDEVTAANPGMQGFELDVSDAAAIAPFAARMRDEFPKLNVLINNAGVAKPQDLTSDTLDVSISTEIIETNLVGPLHLAAVLMPLLKRKPAATIVVTSSGLAFVPNAKLATYSATKAFLHSWVQSLRFQLRDTAIEVLELIPPYVQTEALGPQQATDPHAMPLAPYIAQVMDALEAGNTPSGEILVERVEELRWAEKNDHYDEVFEASNEPE
jgi:uncharacterized oxidoreductase